MHNAGWSGSEMPDEATPAVPKVAGGILGRVPQWAPEAFRALLAPVVLHASRRYVPGPALGDAVRTSVHLMACGCRSTVCFWCPSTATPRAVADSYLAALDALAGLVPGWYLSVKAPDLAMSPRLTLEVVSRAAEAGVRVHFDSHGPETADDTLALASAAHAGHPDVGCTLPGRWQRSLRDADWAVGTGLSVRVVKGQWAEDPRHDGIDPREGFLAVVERLAGRARHVGVASHDPAVVRRALTRLVSAGTPCELELLYGLPAAHVVPIAREMRVPVRVYVPYGRGWLPYCLRQLGRHPHIAWWLLRDLALRRSWLPGSLP